MWKQIVDVGIFNESWKRRKIHRTFQSTKATLRIRMVLVPFRTKTLFFDELCTKLTDELPKLINLIEISVSSSFRLSSNQNSKHLD